MSAALAAERAAPTYRPPLEIAAAFLDRAPVPLPQMAAALGLVVDVDAHLPPDVSGLIARVSGVNGDRYRISINGIDNPARRRFTLAHEIAHFLLHREYLDGEITDDRMYRSRLGDAMERQANRLAAQLLMPGNLVRVAWEAGAHDAAALARTFDVSTQAMEIRLRELGLSR